MPYDMRIRTGDGWINVTDMIAIKHINKVVYAELWSSGRESYFTRSYNQPLGDYREFNGKQFDIIVNGGFVGNTAGNPVVDIYHNWNEKTVIYPGSSVDINIRFENVNQGSHRFVYDIYILEM